MKTATVLFTLAAAVAARLVDRGEEVVFIHPTSGVEMDAASAYASGAVHMVLMDAITEAVADMQAQQREVDALTAPIPWIPSRIVKHVTKFTPCVDGFAGSGPNNTYMCSGLDLLSMTPHALLGSTERIGNDIWGWVHTDAEGATREFALVGQMDGTAFAEILPDGSVVYLGRLPTQSEASIWRDIKTIGHYAYIGSEALGHGIQVFDLEQLLSMELHAGPRTFLIKDLTAHYDALPVGSSHNIVAHEAKNLIVAVGSLPRTDDCGAGLIFVDVSDPANPKSAGCAGQDGYVHDAQCLTYVGPHAKYNGTDVCYAFNENTFTIYNITTPAEPTIISTTYYYGVAYSHQGWVVDAADQRYLLLDDELDEVFQRGWAVDQHTVTYVWDIQDLEHPVMTGHHESPVRAIDHNLYIKDGLAFESNYLSGLRVVDVSSINKDPTGASFKEVAFFDVHPEDDVIGGEAKFGGAWSVYPFFASGNIIVNSMERGLFVLRFAEGFAR